MTKKCKIFAERVSKVFNPQTNRYEDPSKYHSKFRIVKETKNGFEVIGWAHNEKEANAKLKKVKC